jgi:hypothetical protein
MGYSIGFDSNWNRDIGYGVPAFCDEPKCDRVIDRGLSYVCANQEIYGGDIGCGLYFCSEHRGVVVAAVACTHERYVAKPDHPDWINHKLTDPSWEEWRKDNPEFVAAHSTKGVAE